MNQWIDDSMTRSMSFIRVVGAPLLLAGLAGVLGLDSMLGAPFGTTALLGLFAIFSYRELCAMGRERGLRPAEETGSLALAVVFGLAFVALWRPISLPAWLVPGLLLFGLLIRLVTSFGRFTPADAGFSALSAAYVGLLGTAVAMPVSASMEVNGRPLWVLGRWLLFLVATNKGSDIAAYVFGKWLGRHKLAPTVSPNKTWEGAIAGLLVGAGAGTLVLGVSCLGSIWRAEWKWIVLSVAVTVAAQAGDLVKSAIKRWAGVKDSGRLLPEFGGALDMCDSFILSAPVAWVVGRLLFAGSL